MPDLIFLPGAGASPVFWRPVGERLPADWAKAYLGWPGLGGQAPDPAVRRFNDLVDLAEAAMGPGPADLLAQSMGGVVAMSLALRRPERVRRMVLSVTSGGVDVAGLGGSDWRDGYRAAHPEALMTLLEDAPDLTTRLAAITCPVLLLWGDADPISPVAVGQRLLTLLPCARLAVLPGGTHDLVHERPDAVAPLIEAHLS